MLLVLPPCFTGAADARRQSHNADGESDSSSSKSADSVKPTVDDDQATIRALKLENARLMLAASKRKLISDDDEAPIPSASSKKIKGRASPPPVFADDDTSDDDLVVRVVKAEKQSPVEHKRAKKGKTVQVLVLSDTDDD